MSRGSWASLPGVVLLLMSPALAFAHAGGDGGAHHGFADGLVHPFTGIDHLAAMLCVGIWSALAMERRPWVVPLAFIAVLALGAMPGAAGFAWPAVEPMVAASVLVLGLLVATRLRVGMFVGAVLVGAFALFHGAAHGQELIGWPALAGMVVGTALLHAAGLAIGAVLLREKSGWCARVAGSGVALLGAALLFA